MPKALRLAGLDRILRRHAQRPALPLRCPRTNREATRQCDRGLRARYRSGLQSDPTPGTIHGRCGDSGGVTIGLIDILIRNDGRSVSAGATIILSAGLVRVALFF
jgi:hypothetical protein